MKSRSISRKSRVRASFAPHIAFVKARPYAEPANAAARLLEIAKTLRIDEGRMPIGEWNSTFIWKDKASVAEYTLGRDKLIADGIIRMHECGGFFMWKNPAPEGELPGTDQLSRNGLA